MLLVRYKFVQAKKLEQKPQFVLCLIFITMNKAVLLVDAENAFNSINKNVMIHNISVVCPEISTYVSNGYQSTARLFVIGGKQTLSKERTTQGEPTSMGTYAPGVIPLLHFLHQSILINEHRSKEVTFADDLTVAGKIEEIK